MGEFQRIWDNAYHIIDEYQASMKKVK